MENSIGAAPSTHCAMVWGLNIWLRGFAASARMMVVNLQKSGWISRQISGRISRQISGRNSANLRRFGVSAFINDSWSPIVPRLPPEGPSKFHCAKSFHRDRTERKFNAKMRPTRMNRSMMNLFTFPLTILMIVSHCYYDYYERLRNVKVRDKTTRLDRVTGW